MFRVVGMPDPLDAEESAALAHVLPLWTQEGGTLVRVIEAPTFPTAIEWVVLIAEVAERMDHHPDIDIRWRRLRVTLTTHSAGSQVTHLDVQLAQAIDAIAV